MTELFLILFPNENTNDTYNKVYETLVAHFYGVNDYTEANYFCELAIKHASVSIWKYCKLLSSSAIPISNENKYFGEIQIFTYCPKSRGFLLNYALKVCPKEEIMSILDVTDQLKAPTENLATKKVFTEKLKKIVLIIFSGYSIEILCTFITWRKSLKWIVSKNSLLMLPVML